VSTTIRARYVLPIDGPPRRDAWIEVADGRIVTVGSGTPPAGARELGDVAVLPGLVNAHTHTELAWMAGRVPPAASMHRWIGALLRLRRAGVPGGDAAERTAACDAAEAMRAAGTILVGDISNQMATPPVLRGAGLGGVVFHELIGFAPTDPDGQVRDAWARVRQAEAGSGVGGRAPDLDFAVVAHAPYSVAPSLFKAIVHRAADARLAIHLAESPEEVEFLRTGRGPIRDTLESLGVWDGTWRPPECSPVEYMERLGYLRPGVLVVHGVQLRDDDLDRLRDIGAVLVTCPRSNAWVGAGLPRLTHFYASDVPVAIGTDSLASVNSLSLFDELAEMRRIAPDIAASALLDSATRVGAEALGFGADYGTLAPRKRADFAVVDLPADVADVEEYLVSGVPSGAVRPLSL